jgi:hypothetical protein
LAFDDEDLRPLWDWIGRATFLISGKRFLGRNHSSHSPNLEQVLPLAKVALEAHALGELKR